MLAIAKGKKLVQFFVGFFLASWYMVTSTLTQLFELGLGPVWHMGYFPIYEVLFVTYAIVV